MAHLTFQHIVHQADAHCATLQNVGFVWQKCVFAQPVVPDAIDAAAYAAIGFVFPKPITESQAGVHTIGFVS